MGSDMTLRLRDNLHWCTVGGQVIFLDVEEDRYFRLPSRLNAAFERVAASGLEPGDCQSLAALIDRGMLIEDQAAAGLRPPPAIPPATRDFLEAPCPVPGLAQVAKTMLAELQITSLLRRRSLLHVLEAIEQEGVRPCTSSSEIDVRLGGIVAASMAVALVLRAADRCLVRALAVHRACSRSGATVKLVFGVRTDPFAAHCWVQLEEMVLVGEFEQVRLFTPILVLG
jgi:hypothetical protein